MASALRKTRSIKPRSGQRHSMRPAWRGRPGESPGCLPGLTQWLKSLASSLTQLSGRRQMSTAEDHTNGGSGMAEQQGQGGWLSGLREGYAEIGDVRLHYVEAGDGPLIVLLHGFPEFWYGWRLQIEPLAAAGFRVVAPDTRGYNLSSKPEGVASYDISLLAGDIKG